MIAFIGSVFSPYYAWANAKSPAAAENHCAMNVVLYEKRGGYWAMTERKSQSQQRGKEFLQIGPSRLRWEGGALSAAIDEITVPIPRRLRGRLMLTPRRVHTQQFMLDAAGRHRWQPIAPVGRIDVAFDKPAISWSGNAYFDTNDGDVPLGDDFSTWNWSRADGGVETRIFYDVQRRDGTAFNLALQAGDEGVKHFDPPPLQDLVKTGWRLGRQVRADADGNMVVLRTLEDSPFYARSLIRANVAEHSETMVHETLDLRRFARPWVKYLLPFRMPRL